MTFYYVLNRKGETFKVCLSYQEAYLYSKTLRSRVSIIPVIENDASTSHIHSETKKPTGGQPTNRGVAGGGFQSSRSQRRSYSSESTDSGKTSRRLSKAQKAAIVFPPYIIEVIIGMLLSDRSRGLLRSDPTGWTTAGA
jgi:hypothetical protein